MTLTLSLIYIYTMYGNRLGSRSNNYVSHVKICAYFIHTFINIHKKGRFCTYASMARSTCTLMNKGWN